MSRRRKGASGHHRSSLHPHFIFSTMYNPPYHHLVSCRQIALYIGDLLYKRPPHLVHLDLERPSWFQKKGADAIILARFSCPPPKEPASAGHWRDKGVRGARKKATISGMDDFRVLQAFKKCTEPWNFKCSLSLEYFFSSSKHFFFLFMSNWWSVRDLMVLAFSLWEKRREIDIKVKGG